MSGPNGGVNPTNLALLLGGLRLLRSPRRGEYPVDKIVDAARLGLGAYLQSKHGQQMASQRAAEREKEERRYRRKIGFERERYLRSEKRANESLGLAKERLELERKRFERAGRKPPAVHLTDGVFWRTIPSGDVEVRDETGKWVPANSETVHFFRQRTQGGGTVRILPDGRMIRVTGTEAEPVTMEGEPVVSKRDTRLRDEGTVNALSMVLSNPASVTDDIVYRALRTIDTEDLATPRNKALQAFAKLPVRTRLEISRGNGAFEDDSGTLWGIVNGRLVKKE